MDCGVRWLKPDRVTLRAGPGETRMLLLKYLLLFTGAVLAGGALAILIQDIYRARRLWQLDSPDAELVQPPVEIRWRGAEPRPDVDIAVSARH